MVRRRASSSVSLSPSLDRSRDDHAVPVVDRSASRGRSVSRSVDREDREDKSARGVPSVGMMVRGKVTKITSYGAFLAVPTYIDGLLHYTRMTEDPPKKQSTEKDVRMIVREGDELFGKVVIVGSERYSIDIRFVDQKSGEDLDEDNSKRIALEPAIANGERAEDKHKGDPKWGEGDLPTVNTVYSAEVEKSLEYGYLIKLASGRIGLLPRGKAIGKPQTGDRIFVKVVEVLRKQNKFNCDMRYVDPTDGADLDPSNTHSNEKLTTEGILITPELKEKERAERVARRRDPSPRRRRSRSRDGRIARRRSPMNDRSRRDRSSSRRRTASRRDSPEIRRKRSESIVRRRRGRSESEVIMRRR